MASEKLIPVATLSMVSLLMVMMYATDVVVASLSLCELGCRLQCLATARYFTGCYISCVLLRCRQPTPALHSSYDPVSNPRFQCEMECVSLKCNDGLSNAEKASGCVSSCVMNCDKDYQRNKCIAPTV